jgi:hypothetical protein
MSGEASHSRHCSGWQPMTSLALFDDYCTSLAAEILYSIKMKRPHSLFAELFNRYFETGRFPSGFKQANLTLSVLFQFMKLYCCPPAYHLPLVG